MSDEINVDAGVIVPADDAPAVIETTPPEPNWADLTLDQKVDLLHHKMDSVAQQVAWIGQTFQGIIDMVGKVSPMDIFKLMRGGK